MERFDGLLVLDKPSGITSRTAVDRAQKWFPRGTRIGHTGTLDPLASGVLVLCIGVATRLTEYVQRMPKVYRATITLGAVSDTDDADGVITPTPAAVEPTRDEVERTLTHFIGKIKQVPPAYSAAKVAGRRAYKLARKGTEFELAPRTVTVQRIDVLSFTYPHLEAQVFCGKGTYIRSLARDLGERLGCGGYITALRRLEVGPFAVADAVTLDADIATAHSRLQPAWRALQDGPPLALSAADTVKLAQGQRIAAPVGVRGEVAVTDGAGDFLAIVEVVEGWMQPTKVLCGR